MSLRQVEGMFREGDKVEWNSQGGTAVGTVEEMITSRTKAGGSTCRRLQGRAAKPRAQ